MEPTEKTLITVEATMNAPVEKVWKFWTEPKHITQWNAASEEWHTPSAENDLRVGGRFLSRMEAKDGSWGFDFSGVYNKVDPYKAIQYILDDGRKVYVTFASSGNETTVIEKFEAENTHSNEMQQEGWQAILNNFKKYVESLSEKETLHFEITINANVEKVYETMIGENYYKEWTAVFNPGSYFKGSWEKGSKLLFIGTDQDGKEGGMVSRINENIPNKFISIEHVGVYEDGKEITSGPQVESWAGAKENYSFTDVNGKTLLSVDMDSTKEYEDYFKETWPKALDKLKEICER